MKGSEVDWGVLGGALAALVASVGLGSAALTASYEFWSSKDRAYEAETARLLGIRGRYRAVGEEEHLIETYLPRYRALEARGIIGPEHRLDWIEVLRAVSRHLKVPSVRYTVSRQGKYSPEYPVEAGAFLMFASEMELDLGLLHEEDLPRLLSGLDEQAQGLYSVERCEIRRLNDSFAAEPSEPNLSARCKLRWTTVRQPQFGGDAP